MHMSTRPRVFVGSSREALSVARGVKANLEEVAEVRVWDEDVFEPGRYTLEELLRFTRSFDFGVFVWSPDDLTLSREQESPSPRDNVVLEAGIFYGALGRDRVFLVAPSTGSTKIPSDLLGLSVVSYFDPSDGNYRAAVASGCHRIVSRIKDVGPQNGVLAEPQGPTTVRYANLDIAKPAIQAACKDSRGVKILSNKGLVFFGLDESIISLAEAAEYTKLERLRILLLHPESRWINRGLMALRQYESLSDFKKELTSVHQIAESGMGKFAKQLDLHNSGIKYHHSEPYFRMVITDDVAFVSTYAEHPSVQVRDLPVFAFHNEPGGLYGSLKRHFNDLWHNQSGLGDYLRTTIEPEVSAGGILVAHVGLRAYVALVMRDDGSWVLPKGHKEVNDRDLELAAVREVSEETGVPASQIRVIKRLDEYAYDETAVKHESTKIVYLFLMQYRDNTLPELRSDADHSDARWWPVDQPFPFMFYAYQRTLLAEVMQNEFGTDLQFE